MMRCAAVLRPKEFALLTGAPCAAAWSHPCISLFTRCSVRFRTGHGIYHGRMSFKSRGGAADKVVSGEKVWPYPAPVPGAPDTDRLPVSIGLTEFHFLLLFPSRLLAVSKLSGEVVFEQGFKERFGEMRGMVTDGCIPGSVVPFVWLFSSRYGTAVPCFHCVALADSLCCRCVDGGGGATAVVCTS